jgi:hypothetical protein
MTALSWTEDGWNEPARSIYRRAAYPNSQINWREIFLQGLGVKREEAEIMREARQSTLATAIEAHV